jgi:class 3 adenylate cyclase
LFNVKKIKRNVELLTSIGLSGQSEIMTDISSLSEKEIINNNVQTIIYASLKVKHRIMGAIILASKENITYSAGDLKLLVTLALQSSSAIESALQYEKNIKEARDREETMRRIYEATNKFVPHEFIKSLGHNLITDVKLGDQVEKIVTVLFTDIRDFTGISEKMSPSENFQFVSSFNEKLGPIIRKHNGFINQYLGDSIMAIFPENPIDALHAAVGMHQAINELNELRIANGFAKIKAGIGMHTGPLVMGITGDEKRLDAATISDTVNTAARIESLTKYYQSPLLLSHETMEYAHNANDFIFRQLGSVRLKGKAKLLNIVECINAFDDGIKAKKSSTLSDFTNAMNAYLNGDFEAASNLFDSVIAFDPEDQTALFFGCNAKKYMHEGAPENWSGAVEMTNK